MAAAWNGVTTCTNAGYRAAFLGVLSGFSAQNYRCHFVFDGYAWRLPSWHEPSAWSGENPFGVLCRKLRATAANRAYEVGFRPRWHLVVISACLFLNSSHLLSNRPAKKWALSACCMEAVERRYLRRVRRLRVSAPQSSDDGRKRARNFRSSTTAASYPALLAPTEDQRPEHDASAYAGHWLRTLRSG